MAVRSEDERFMEAAIRAAATVRLTTSPNPWVGAVLVTTDGHELTGATQPPGGNHAEIEALAAAGDRSSGATLYVTLEPCAHQGRTPPCADAIVAAGVARVVVGLEDPDRAVGGRGIEQLRAAGVEVLVGVGRDAIAAQLRPYLHHRRTGRPWVVLKSAITLDGHTAAADGSSRWITGPEARADGQRLRAESDAVLVGAGTVRADDPRLTVRDFDPPAGVALSDIQPLRIVLGSIPAGAAVRPAVELHGDLAAVLDELGDRGILQLLVEGGARVAGDFHRAGLVDRYVVYLAPALMGGDDGRPVFAGPGAASIAAAWRGRIVDVHRLGDDLRIELASRGESPPLA